jgi:DNA polymerase-3 subunit epsilon
MLREIVLDTETTGLSPKEGDKIVEIGCVELINHIPSGKNYHIYLNPERDMPDEAFRVHGLSSEFLADKTKFIDEYAEFLEFIADSTLIIHNAPFDMGFLNAELKYCNKEKIQNKVIDTVLLARKVHPGARVSLDALCKTYNIDLSRRSLHGALLDSEILAQVYLELIGGRQVGLALNIASKQEVEKDQNLSKEKVKKTPATKRQNPLAAKISEEEETAHSDLLKKMGKNAIWNKYQNSI